jgi:hypothetical protein
MKGLTFFSRLNTLGEAAAQRAQSSGCGSGAVPAAHVAAATTLVESPLATNVRGMAWRSWSGRSLSQEVIPQSPSALAVAGLSLFYSFLE